MILWSHSDVLSRSVVVTAGRCCGSCSSYCCCCSCRRWRLVVTDCSWCAMADSTSTNIQNKSFIFSMTSTRLAMGYYYSTTTTTKYYYYYCNYYYYKVLQNMSFSSSAISTRLIPIVRVTTHLENLEKSGNSKVVRDKLLEKIMKLQVLGIFTLNSPYSHYFC